jgi:acetoin utilization deacetylase AcuC-like enzyme
MPDTVLHPALREGMGEAPEPSGAIGRIGYWCWETMTPLVAGSYRAARAAVDVALTAADLLLAGDAAVYGLARPPGHHCPRSAFGGYGLFNYSAVASAYLADRVGRVAVLDVDYHHGNGTQQIFYHRADVLYVSLHADPDRAFPYFIGWADEHGAGPGEGFTVNLPLPGGCTNDRYLAALDRARAHRRAQRRRARRIARPGHLLPGPDRRLRFEHRRLSQGWPAGGQSRLAGTRAARGRVLRPEARRERPHLAARAVGKPA